MNNRAIDPGVALLQATTVDLLVALTASYELDFDFQDHEDHRKMVLMAPPPATLPPHLLDFLRVHFGLGPSTKLDWSRHAIIVVIDHAPIQEATPTAASPR